MSKIKVTRDSDLSRRDLLRISGGCAALTQTLSVDEYAAELAMWFGIDNDANLESILPNIRNFYSASDTFSPLGFLPAA